MHTHTHTHTHTPHKCFTVKKKKEIFYLTQENINNIILLLEHVTSEFKYNNLNTNKPLHMFRIEIAVKQSQTSNCEGVDWLMTSISYDNMTDTIANKLFTNKILS